MRERIEAAFPILLGLAFIFCCIMMWVNDK